jgi:hypothetical protein
MASYSEIQKFGRHYAQHATTKSNWERKCERDGKKRPLLIGVTVEGYPVGLRFGYVETPERIVAPRFATWTEFRC